MCLGTKWFKTGFLVGFFLFFGCALFLLGICAITGKGDGQLIVLYTSFPSSALAHGLSGTLRVGLGFSYQTGGFWEALLGGFLGAIQYGLVTGILGLLASAIASMVRRKKLRPSGAE